MAINYTEYMIDQIRAFVKENDTLKDVIPQENITDFFNPKEAVIPSIIVKTIQDEPMTLTFAREVTTVFTTEIQINCQLMDFGGVGFLPNKSCRIVADELVKFLEEEMRFRRRTKTDPIPIDDTNETYALYMRYSAKHNLLTNTISRN